MTSTPDQPRITLVCCGLLGCLVSDEGLIERSYAEAIATQGVVSGTSAFARRMAQVHQGRGQAPSDVLRLLFPENEARALAARLAFDRALGDALHRFEVKPAPGVIEALARLRGAGRTVCVLSGFPEPILDAVLDETGLRRHIDLALTVADAPRGFPAPDLVLTAMLRTGADAVSAVAVTDATSAGVAAGHRAGAGFVAGLLTGPHASARLKQAGADVVLRGFAALPEALPGRPGGASGRWFGGRCSWPRRLDSGPASPAAAASGAWSPGPDRVRGAPVTSGQRAGPDAPAARRSGGARQLVSGSRPKYCM